MNDSKIHNFSLHTINYRTNVKGTFLSIRQLAELNKIPVNQALTDSLSLKIPLSECEVIDQRLTSTIAIFYESLDMVGCEVGVNCELPPKPIIESKNGITVRFSKVEIPIYNPKTQEKDPTQFVDLTVSAKLLKERYFEGINKENIEVLYQAFIDFKIFNCSLETFLNGMASDIDICINRYTETPQVFSDVLKSLVTQSGTKAKYLRLFSEIDNVGLTFKERKTAKASLPFIKFYHKELELLNKSAEFFNFYLSNYAASINNLTRVEATIKNYDHKRRLEKYFILPKFRTLKEYLEIPQNELFNFVVFSIDSYIEFKPRIKAPNLSPMDHLIYEFMQNSVLSGYDYENLLSAANSFKSANPKSTVVSQSRMRKKITELYDLLNFKDDKIGEIMNLNENVKNYLRMLGIKTELKS